MVFSYYLLKAPYSFIWNILKLFRRKTSTIFFCEYYLDYLVAKNVLQHLDNVTIVAKNKHAKKELEDKGIKCSLWPVYPDNVIMTRHGIHKFPCSRIKLIGMRHGPYHFKKMIGKKKYNAFDLFLMTSEHEVNLAKELGIESAKSGGFSKLDDAFNGNISKDQIDKLRQELNFDRNKKTIIFSSTYDKSGMSTIDKWYENIGELTSDYNVIVTLHPFMSEKYVSALKNRSDIYFLEDNYTLPYLMLADLMVADASSIIAEFCSLNKPLVTFKTQQTPKLTPEIQNLIKDISFQINDFPELKSTIELAFSNFETKQSAYTKYNQMMFDKLDGNHGKKAASLIKDIVGTE